MNLEESKTAAYAIFPAQAEVEQILGSLNSAGFADESICVFLTPTHPIAEGLQQLKRGTAGDLSQEAQQAAVLQWLSRFGAVVIHGVGFFIGSREFLSALAPSRPQYAGQRGELLQGLGIPQPDAARYEARVRNDASLIFVSCEGIARSEWAREILRSMQAEEVRSLGDGNSVRWEKRTEAVSGLAS